MAPIKLEIEADVRTVDGSRPPTLNRFLIRFDANGRVSTKGLATCDQAELAGTSSEEASRRCENARIGKGDVTVDVARAGQAPLIAPGRLLAFNGRPQGRKPVILLHAVAALPEPTTLVIPAVIGKSKRPFGNQVVAEIPPIAGGAGALTHLEVKLHRTWRHRGKRRSYVSARCAAGHLIAEGSFDFDDGSQVTGSIVRPCKAKRGKRQRAASTRGGGRNPR